MKRFGIPISALLLVLACAYLATDNGSVVAQAPAKAKAVAADKAALVPLFNSDTKLEPATIIDTPEALITRVADRVRDRHAREHMFRVYEHWQPQYFEHRTHAIEVVDKVAKGGDSVTYNVTSLVPLNGPNLRAFFVGKGTVAQYSNNSIAKKVDDLHYTLTITKNTNEGGRALKIGDRIEIEFSVFLDKKAVTGRTAYYGTPLLYVVGTPGMQPWEGKGQYRDSFPLPELALSGGATTMHQSYSNEPKSLFQQMATNTAPINSQPFVMGRRLHHTDFGTGVHSEPGNPVFKEHEGRLGQHFVGRSCIACHANNGRALPAAVGKPMTQCVVHVGIDAKGTPHPKLGATLQSQTTNGTPEGTVTIDSWTTTNGTYGDGTAYALRKPVYKFTGVVPEFYSIRLAPPLVGQGLLEALDEGTIAKLSQYPGKQTADTWGHMRTVADPESGQMRLGRFGWKASQPRLKHQIASALNNDMGIPTPVYPKLDQGSEQSERTGKELSAADLENLYRYVALLAVPPRRDYADTTVVKGETLFASAGCAKCHTTTMKTSPYHPLSELRNQTIHPFTDMLVHDMGKGLADNMAEGNASGADWRTTPLWGIGLTKGVSGGEAYLHDGRARDLSEAILWHGGEGEESKEAFRTMPAADRAALIRFLQSL